MNPADRYKPFVKAIEAASGRYRASDVFVDACHMMALSIWSPLCFGEARRKAEADYRATAEKFDKREFQHICDAFACLVEALADKREEFLGHCMNIFEATNKWIPDSRQGDKSCPSKLPLRRSPGNSHPRRPPRGPGNGGRGY